MQQSVREKNAIDDQVQMWMPGLGGGVELHFADCDSAFYVPLPDVGASESSEAGVELIEAGFEFSAVVASGES
jgi:hypothetical protein